MLDGGTNGEWTFICAATTIGPRRAKTILSDGSGWLRPGIPKPEEWPDEQVSADAGVPAGSGLEPLDVDAVIDVPLGDGAAAVAQIAGRYRGGATG